MRAPERAGGSAPGVSASDVVLVRSRELVGTRMGEGKS